MLYLKITKQKIINTFSMAVIIKTNNPLELLSLIKQEISSKNIENWSYDCDGDFTHTSDQWKSKAWFIPAIRPGELRFGILANKKFKMTDKIYGVYHGRFTEMLLLNFDNKFSNAIATSQKTEPDNF